MLTRNHSLYLENLKKNLNDSVILLITVDAQSRTKTKEIVRKTKENIKNHKNNTGH